MLSLFSQVNKLFCLFKVNPDTVFLVEEVESYVIFSTDTARAFLYIPGVTYEVHRVQTTTAYCTSKAPRMDYSVVIQMFLCLTPDQCIMRLVRDLVT